MLAFAERDTATQVAEIFKALADPTRLRILGLVAERPRTGKDLASALDVGAPTISHHMEKLTATGIVSVRPDGQLRWYALDRRALATLADLAALIVAGGQEAGVQKDEATRNRDQVIRNFFDGPRLRQIPSGRKKRVIVLQHLMERFQPGREYTEKAVNTALRDAHEDFATLRRELVDYGYLTRKDGIYRVADALPERSAQVGQEITGDEHAWLAELIARATAGETRQR